MFTSIFRWLVALLGLGVTAVATEIDREIILAPQSDADVQRWQERIAAKNAKPADYERLGWAFVGKARRTLDAGFYKLAEKTADVMDAHFGATVEARLLRGHVFHNLHRFADAETVARQLVAERGQPEDFALLSDVLMEQGKLPAAVEACQRLVDLRPGLEAYSRIAHLRWLKGDLAGATAAMEQATHAAGPRDVEGRAWALSRLSGYYLQAGRSDAAMNAAEVALRHAADFPPAFFARGRALLALGKSEAAIGALQRAAELNPLPEYQWWLADALEAAGRTAEAAKVVAVIKQRGEVSDPRTFALFLATRRDDALTAVRLAREELAQRGDVFSHDALAWALAAGGVWAAADTEMRAALAEGTKDARLFFHAAEIARRRGRAEEAEKFAAEARKFAGTLTPSERAALERLLAGEFEIVGQALRLTPGETVGRKARPTSDQPTSD